MAENTTRYYKTIQKPPVRRKKSSKGNDKPARDCDSAQDDKEVTSPSRTNSSLEKGKRKKRKRPRTSPGLTEVVDSDTECISRERDRNLENGSHGAADGEWVKDEEKRKDKKKKKKRKSAPASTTSGKLPSSSPSAATSSATLKSLAEILGGGQLLDGHQVNTKAATQGGQHWLLALSGRPCERREDLMMMIAAAAASSGTNSSTSRAPSSGEAGHEEETFNFVE